MNKELKEILDKLKYCVEKNEYLEETNMKNWKPLLDYITNLQQENERLNNIINELEKWLQNEYNEWSMVDDDVIRAEARQCIEVLDKLQEIKENNK